VVIGVAIFMVQNSTAPPVVMKFLFWNFKTSLIDTILVSVGSGMLIILFLWIPRSIKASFREKNLKKEIEILERQMKLQGVRERQANHWRTHRGEGWNNP